MRSVVFTGITTHFADQLSQSIVEKLKQKADTRDIQKREQEINARVHAQYEKQQQRLGDLVRYLGGPENLCASPDGSC